LTVAGFYIITCYVKVAQEAGSTRRVRVLGSAVAVLINAAIGIPAAVSGKLLDQGFQDAGYSAILAVACAVGAVVGAVLGYRAAPEFFTVTPPVPRRVAVIALQAVLIGAVLIAVSIVIASSQLLNLSPPPPDSVVWGRAESLGEGLALTAYVLAIGLAILGIPAFVFAVIVVALWAEVLRFAALRAASHT
jgi:hypothetical protein